MGPQAFWKINYFFQFRIPWQTGHPLIAHGMRPQALVCPQRQEDAFPCQGNQRDDSAADPHRDRSGLESDQGVDKDVESKG